MNSQGSGRQKKKWELTWIKKFDLNLILTYNIYNIILQSTP